MQWINHYPPDKSIFQLIHFTGWIATYPMEKNYPLFEKMTLIKEKRVPKEATSQHVLSVRI